MPELNEYVSFDITPSEFLYECTKTERRELFDELADEFAQPENPEVRIPAKSLADVIKEENLNKLAKLDHSIIEKLVEDYNL